MIINCKDKAEEIKLEVKNRVSELVKAGNIPPRFTIISVGHDPASESYVRGKVKDCEYCGIKVNVLHYAESVNTDFLCNEVFNAQIFCNAIIVQLPLPDHIDKDKVLNCITPSKDVDGLTEGSYFKPCTPLGVMCVLKDICKLDLTDKNVLMIGRSKLVGLPLCQMLQEANANVSLCHSKTSRLNLFRQAIYSDVIISAVGKPNVLDSDDIPVDAYVIDVGINRDENGKLCGDIMDGDDYYKTPVPNGVGLLTRAMLLKNILEAYERCYK